MRATVACAFALAAGVTGCRAADGSGPSPAPAPAPDPAPGDLPAEPERILDDLLADDLRLVGAKDVNGAVHRLELERGGRRFRAKWKALGPGGSEVQDGFDGNNAPRCEVAAWRVNRLLFGKSSTERHLVAPVVVRAFHRDVPCTRACALLPRLPGLAQGATFPQLNDHLVVGALTWWIDDVSEVARFRGGLWDRRRFDASPAYRRSFSDLCLFLYLIGHGDANYSANFLLRTPGLDRIYSIDNGRAFDGVAYYTSGADPDWRPFARLAPGRLVAPTFSRQTVERLAALDRTALERELRIVAALEMETGRAIRDPTSVPALGLGALLADPAAEHRGRGVHLARRGGRSWVLLGIGEAGIVGVADRAARLVRWLRGTEGAVLE